MRSRRLVLKALAAALATRGGRSFAKSVEMDLAKLIADTSKEFGQSAMGIAIVRGDAAPQLAAGGHCKRGDAREVTLEDAWHMGSLTKSMTAALFAQAVERKHFAWEDTLEKHFPGCHADHRKTTLWQLFEHQAGFAHSGPEILWNQLHSRTDSPMGQRAWWAPAALAEKRGLPAGQHKYSNLGCVIIGHLLEKAANTPWETLLKKNLAEPLGLRSVGFGPTTPIWGHTEKGKPLQEDNPAALGPAGTAHMTLGDFASYAAWHMRQGKGSALELTPESWEKLHTTRLPRPNKAAGEPTAGWFVCRRPWAKGDCLTHTGSNTMNYAMAWIAPKEQLALVSVSNQGGNKAGEACDSLIAGSLRALGLL
jgi:D-alanyl-D-alanine carboxypeptidase